MKNYDGSIYATASANVSLDGDGKVLAFWFKDGRVDLKMRYIGTDRYKLKRNAGKAILGLYQNSFTHHPCVRAAVDSTTTRPRALPDHLLALKEGGNACTNELVVSGYKAKGSATTEVVVYSHDSNCKKVDEQWLQSPWFEPFQGCAITPHWLMLRL